MKDFGFYLVITDPITSYEACAEAAVKCGVKIIQLRIKDLDEKKILQTAYNLRDITKNTNTLFIVNDNPYIAKKCNADGIHLGQSDMSIIEAKKIYPKVSIIGLSTHNTEQALKALKKKPDYIGAGPVYKTPTKKIPDPVLGIAGMQNIINIANIPVVAIGGIDQNNLSEVLSAGAKNFASVRAIVKSLNPETEIQKLLNIYKKYCNKL